MLLENLPNELLSMILKQLSHGDRFSLRNTSRKFNLLVNSKLIFPLDPLKIDIDFGNQIIVVSAPEKNYQLLSFVYARESELGPNGLKRFPSDFLGTVRCFYEVGERWSELVQEYFRKLNRKFRKVAYCALRITFESPHIPPEIFPLFISLRKLEIYGGVKGVIPIPDLLSEWVFKVLTKDSQWLMVDFALSVEQLYRLKPPNCSCRLDDEAAMSILDKFSNVTLPEEMNFWGFTINSDSSGFLAQLRADFDLEPSDQQSVLLRGRVFMSLFYKEDSLHVRIYGPNYRR